MSTTITGLLRKQNYNVPGILKGGNVAITGDRVAIRGSTTDNINGAPWYGIGYTNVTNGSGFYTQVAGYYGLRFKTSNNDLVINQVAGDITLNGNKVWHAGNDGAGSGLDADKLDSLNSTQFLRSDADDTTTGALTISKNTQYPFHITSPETTVSGIGIKFNDISTQTGYLVANHSDADAQGAGYSFQFSSNQSTTDVILVNGGNFFVGPNAVYHAGNLSPVKIDATNQSVGNSFGVNGLLNLNRYSTTTGSELYMYNKGSIKTIELDSDATTAHNNTTTNLNVLIGGGDGSAKFAGSVKVNRLHIGATSGAPLSVSSTDLVSNLNAEYLGGLRYDKYDTKISNYEIGGDGVYSGLEVTETSPPTLAVTVTPGVVYLQDGTRAAFTGEENITLAAGDASSPRIDVIYVAGSGTNQGELQVQTGTAAASPTVPSIPSDAVKIAEVRMHANASTVTDGSSGATDMIDDKRRWKSVLLNGTTFAVNASIKENGQLLTDKYAQLATGNTFSGDILINKASAKLEILGTTNSDSESPSLLLTESGNYGMEIKYLTNANIATINMVEGNTNREAVRISRSDASVTVQQKLYANGLVRANKNAKTITVSAGQTSATWTHNYGATTYAVNLTPNGFARHVAWNNKTNNSITIEIDDVYNEDILVDCILIGY